jgi:hypothetical protein
LLLQYIWLRAREVDFGHGHDCLGAVFIVDDRAAGRRLVGRLSTLFAVLAFLLFGCIRLLRTARVVLVADERLEIELHGLHPGLERFGRPVEDVGDPVGQRPEGVLRQAVRRECAVVPGHEPDDVFGVFGEQLAHHVAPKVWVQLRAGRQEQVWQAQVRPVGQGVQHQFWRRVFGMQSPQHDGLAAVLLANREGEAGEQVFIGALDEASQLRLGVVAEYPHLRPGKRPAAAERQRHDELANERYFLPRCGPVRQGKLHHLVDVAEGCVVQQGPVLRPTQEQQLAFGRLDQFEQRVGLAKFDPDVGRAFDVGHRRGRLAVAVDGAQQRVVRRPDDAQQCPRLAGVIAKPTKALAVVAEA